MKKRVLFFHMLNDFSGSPNVLSQIISGLAERGFDIDLYTSSRTGGFLSGIENIKYHTIFYRYTKSRVAGSVLFIIAQIRYFFVSLQFVGNRNVIFYINTILPFGAAIGAWLSGAKIIYLIHERPVKMNIMQKFAISVFTKLSDKVLFVSKYLFDSYNIDLKKKILVYNSISPGFALKAKNHTPDFQGTKNILMACSLKKYKGVFVFIELAGLLPEYNFHLVLNSDDKLISEFFKKTLIPKNIAIYPVQKNLIPFYEKANLVVNLSLPDLCIESFGLTILESLTFGIPVIVPPIGGITELVSNGINGFLIDSRNLIDLKEKVIEIFTDKAKYSKMSVEARASSENFSYLYNIEANEKALIDW